MTTETTKKTIWHSIVDAVKNPASILSGASRSPFVVALAVAAPVLPPPAAPEPRVAEVTPAPPMSDAVEAQPKSEVAEVREGIKNFDRRLDVLQRDLDRSYVEKRLKD